LWPWVLSSEAIYISATHCVLSYCVHGPHIRRHAFESAFLHLPFVWFYQGFFLHHPVWINRKRALTSNPCPSHRYGPWSQISGTMEFSLRLREHQHWQTLGN
jgi:hypothetical protein